MLDRYGLSSRALSHQSGERSSREPGQSVEFHDFRPYQPGDELRYVKAGLQPFLIGAEKAARIISRGAKRGQDTIIVPWQFRILRGVTQLLPRFILRWALSRA